MKKVLASCTVIFFLLLFSGYFYLLSAGQVTLEISTTTGVAGSRVSAGYKITNKGSDTARDIAILGQFLGQQKSVFITDRLLPGQTAESGSSYTLPENLQGSFPLFITISYRHADGVSVSSASLAEVNTGLPGKKMLDAKAEFAVRTGGGEASIKLEASDPAVEMVTVTAHGPGDLALEPPVQSVQLEKGKGQAKFTVTNISGEAGSVYGVFFAAESEAGGRHILALADVAVPAEKIKTAVTPESESLTAALYAAMMVFAALVILAIIFSSSFRLWLFSLQSVPHLLDISVLAAVEIFIFSRFDLATLFTATTTTGGDTASHYYTLEYLRHTLLPAGKISGWTMGNYGGFPILQFYFPLPFLIMCLLDLLMPLQVAFKLVTLLGTALLPAAAYTMLRLLRCPFPGPGIGAVLMLPFLFNSANSMWGGNFLSTLAGEFSYSLSMALSLVLAGSIYRGALEDKWTIRNSILVFLVGFSHGYTLLFAEALSLFVLITPYGFSRRAFYLFRVYGLGFCLLAFWLVPLLVFTKYTTSYHLVWTIHSLKEVVPEILLPPVIAAVGGSCILLVAGIVRYRTLGREVLGQLAYLWYGLAAAVVFFVAAPRIGVVDIRYVPYGQLMLCLMAALFLGWTGQRLLKRWGLNWILLIAVTAGVMYWTGARTGPVSGWFKWNYEGFEAKKTWPLFEQINKKLHGDFQEPRVIFEHSQDHNAFGSSRAFESLPLFAGRATLEGLYMQASITAPFVFYLQTLVSAKSSQPFPQYSYTTMNFTRARHYLELFNVSDLILKSTEAKGAIRQAGQYTRSGSIGQYELWHLSTNPGRYIDVLQAEPVVYLGNDPWKQVAYQWFTRDELGGVHLVFNESLVDNRGSPLGLSTDSLETLPRQETDTSDCRLRETINAQEILLETTCPGKPHLVKVSYHPNWQVAGAEKVYLASPSFMLIYPQQEKVRLYYGPGPWDRLGQLLTLLGLAVLLLHVPLPGKGGRSTWSVLADHMPLPDSRNLHILPNPNPITRKIIMLTVLATAAIFIAAGSYRTYVNEPYRIYNRSINYKDSGLYKEARAGFHTFMQTYPLANLARESSYYIAITYYLEKNDQEAIRSFDEYLQRYPQGSRVAEVNYHAALSLMRSGREDEARRRMQMLTEKYPSSSWAAYAKERLLEQGFSPRGARLEINGSNLGDYMGRAIAYFNQDRLDEAKPILKRISERFPDFEGAPQALAALALCYYKEDDCPNTIRYYQKLLQRYPENKLAAEAYFHIGICYEKMGRLLEAEEAFRKVLKKSPDSIYSRQAQEKLEK